MRTVKMISFALILPLAALLIERLLPYPYIVEELLKGSLVISLKKNKLVLSFLIGVFFAITETFLYSTSIMLTGGGVLFFKRLLITSILHSLTTLVMGLSILKNKKFFLLGLIAAIAIHYFYNASQIPL